MRTALLFALSATLLFCGCMPGSQQSGKTYEVIKADDAATPTKREKIGECTFYPDYSFKIKTNDPDLEKNIAAAIRNSLKKEELMLRSEEMKGDVLIMSGDMLKPGDKNYIFALVIDVARQLNEGNGSAYYSLEYLNK